MPKSLHIHDRRGKSTIGWVIQGGQRHPYLTMAASHPYYQSIAHFHPFPKGQWWHYHWNGMRCHKLPPVGISWQSGDQDTHFLTHTHTNTIAYLMGFDGLIFSSSQADKHVSTAITYQGAGAWLFALWSIWVMNTFTGWQRQLRISHTCLDLQATCKLFSCSDIKPYVIDKVTVSILNRGKHECSIWQKTK